MSQQALLEVPASISAVTEVVSAWDQCLSSGFGRLGSEQIPSLEALARVVAGTPLAEPVKLAVEAIGRNEFVEKHFAALALARAALQGAQYDALRAEAARVLKRPTPEAVDPQPAVATAIDAGPIAVWQESTRNWLMEVALAGFEHLEYAILEPFQATLEHLQDEPAATRLASLLTGFLNELLRALPITPNTTIPVYRWSDLWTRAMVAALREPSLPVGEKVGGDLTLLATDLRHHGYVVSANIHGLLEQAGTTRAVRLTLSAYKVDVLVGTQLWRCFTEAEQPILQALAKRHTLKISDCTLLPTGDLLHDGSLTLGKEVDLPARAKEAYAIGASHLPQPLGLAAADRHPLHLAEPVYLEGYTVKADMLELADGTNLALATRRISSAAELQAKDLAGSTGLFGLLRFDGGAWGLQPLLAQTSKGPVYTGMQALEHSRPQKKDTLELLEERASRLLRAKA